METIGRRGTTFVVPYVIKNFELSNIDELCLVMVQGRNIIVKKKLEDVSIEGDTINVIIITGRDIKIQCEDVHQESD